ncbi:secreted antigen 1 [Babesia divergens]|uniref:Secreted antigen 1 n=1 Tax=Babesia divergens TaxID=32595 RepID=A0AAD9LE50_BABDI|nr:secreted antigen 1 [Babesia divergens]
MKLLGILRASALCLLVSGFRGPRGVFCSNLEVNPYAESPTVEVSEISENPKDSPVKSSSAASAPVAKSGLVFQSSKWHDSHLASSVLFLEEFCRDLISKKFNKKLCEYDYDAASRACVYLSFKLESVTNHFAPTYGPGTVSERKEIPKNFYKDVLKPEKFDDYTYWLVKNIQNITESYKKMLEESVKLTATELKTETSRGPLKYGFVYNGYWCGEIIYWLPPDVYTDTGFLEALNELKISLVKIPRIPVETSTVDYQINEDDVEEPFSADVSDISGNLDGSPVEPQVVEDAIEESSKVNETDIAENKGTTVEPQPSAPSSQSDLVFENYKWDDSHLASAFLFLEEFCLGFIDKNGIFAGNISDKRLYGDVKAVCGDCMVRLKFLSHYFIPTYGPGAVSERKELDNNIYKGKLEPEKFTDYIHWLVKNIPAIKKSVINMNNEVFTHSQTVLKTETSVGPLKYGFAYMGDKWKQLHDWSSGGDIYSLLTFSLSLEKLQHYLEKVLKSSPRRSTVVDNPEESSVEPRPDIPTQFEDLVEDSKRLHTNADFSKDSTSEDNEDKSRETNEDT